MTDQMVAGDGMTLDDLLDDPIIRLPMASDGVMPVDIRQLHASLGDSGQDSMTIDRSPAVRPSWP